MTPLLTGLRIVEGSAFIAAPLAGMTMAQMGAEVIRFDLPGGGIDYRRWPIAQVPGAAEEPGGHSIYWANLNKGKKSLAIDFRTDEGRELLGELITAPGDERGILLTNFPMAGWLSWDKLTAKRPDLIALNVIGNPDGSVAVDYTVNAAVGYPIVTGDGLPEAPVNHVFPGWDVATAYAAATGLLAAERHRRLTGEGQRVELSLANMAFATVANLGNVAEVQVNAEGRPNIGNDVYGSYGRDFGTADGRRVMVIAVSVAQWLKLVEATGIAGGVAAIEAQYGLDLKREEHRYQARDAIGELIEPWCAARSLADIRAIFDAHNVCWGPYQSFAQMVEEDPRVSAANPMFQEIDQPGIGRYLATGLPHDFSAVARGPVAPAPALGEHTDEILAEALGLSAAEIGRLHDTGIVAGAQTPPTGA